MSELPSEVWEHIFWYLNKKQLLGIRLTCHRFRNIVSNCPKLRDKLKLRFIAINEPNFNPLPVPATSNVEFRCSTLQNTNVWWPSIGAMITSLTFNECSFQLDMLAHTLNLKRLHISYGKVVPSTLNFKLHKMEQLTLLFNNPKICKNLMEIIPCLIELNFLNSYDFFIDHNHIEACSKMVEAMQGTLNELKVYAKSSLFEMLSKIRKLKLKRITIKGAGNEMRDESVLLDFFKTQPAIEQLSLESIYLSESTLQHLGMAQPNLKRFTLCVDHITKMPSFHNTMTNLEYLCLRFKSFKLFDVSVCPNLKELKVLRADVQAEKIKEFLKQHENIKSLQFIQCSVDTVNGPQFKGHMFLKSDVYAKYIQKFLKQLKTYESVQFIECYINTHDLRDIVMYSEVDGFAITLLITPNVTVKCDNISEEVLIKIGRTLRNYKRLIVKRDFVTRTQKIEFSNDNIFKPRQFDIFVDMEFKNNNLMFANLEEVYIYQATIEADMWSRILHQASNFHTLKLDGCKLKDSQLIKLVTQIKQLKFLYLSNTKITINTIDDDESRSNLKFLWMDNVRVSDDDLTRLFQFIPQLTKLHLTYENGSCETLKNDELIEELCQKCKLLEKFSLDEACCISLNSLHAIFQNLKALRGIQVKYTPDSGVESKPVRRFRLVISQHHYYGIIMGYYQECWQMTEILKIISPKHQRMMMTLDDAILKHFTVMPPLRMNNLEKLDLAGYYGRKWLIDDCRSMLPKLEVLKLYGVKVNGDNLHKILQNSPALHSVKLNDCSFESANPLSLIIQQNLKVFDLCNFDFTNRYDLAKDSPITTLQCLRFSNVCISESDLRNTFRLFPELVELFLDYNVHEGMIPDETIAEMCNQLIKLKSLVLGPVRGIGMGSLQRIIRHLPELKRMIVSSHFSEDDEAFASAIRVAYVKKDCEKHVTVTDTRNDQNVSKTVVTLNMDCTYPFMYGLSGSTVEFLL